MYKFSEIIKKYVLEPILLPNDELHFQIEILQNENKKFHARLLRRELYRLKPTSEIDTDVCADEYIYILDRHTLDNLDQQLHESENTCLQTALRLLEEKFT